MTSPSLVLGAMLLLGPPSDAPAPEVQRPSVAPTQPQPGEPAIAPAEVPGEAAVAPSEPTPTPEGTSEPAPAGTSEPAPEGTSEPAPAGTSEAPPSTDTLPTWNSTPVEPAPGDADLPAVDEWGVPVVAPVIDNSPPKGGGFFAGAGAVFGVMISKQLFMGLFCQDVYCGWRGNFDRALGFATVGLAGAGGWFDGRRRAYMELKDGTEQKSLTKRRAAGWTLFSVGMAGILTDMVLYHMCYDGALGPYTNLEGFSYTCEPVASVLVVDFGTIMSAVGIGLGLSAESQRRHRERNDFDLSLAPWGGRGTAGLTLSGRF